MAAICPSNRVTLPMSTSSTGVPNVLIVEDEMMLRMRAVDIVEDAGFRSVEAVNADEAMSILESRSDISLLFTDIQMPGSMDGLKLAHAVHNRWPDIKIILVSGQVKPSEAEQAGRQPLLRQAAGDAANDHRIADHGGRWRAEDRSEPDRVRRRRRPFTRQRRQGRADRAAALGARGGLSAENDSLRLLLEQAGIDAKVLLAQAGIDAKEREAADKLQKLILGELHHRIKNTLATVSAIASQSFRAATSIEHGQKAMEGRLAALGRAHDLLMQISWSNASLTHTFSGATEPYRQPGRQAIPFQRAGYPDYLGRRHRAGDDVQRALHQHHEIRRALDAHRPRRNRLDDRRRKAAAAPDLDRKGRPAGPASDTAQLRHPHDGVARPAIERPGAALLRSHPGFVYALDVPLGSLIAAA